MTSGPDTDLKLTEIELPSNLSCKETFNRLLSQNALWLVTTLAVSNAFDVFIRTAFQELDNAMVTNEQRVLEVKIERTYQQLNEICEERVKGDAPKHLGPKENFQRHETFGRRIACKSEHFSGTQNRLS